MDLASQFPAVVVLGPRQVGKTTLARATFPGAAYKDIEIKVTCLVDEKYTELAVRTLHDVFDLDKEPQAACPA